MGNHRRLCGSFPAQRLLQRHRHLLQGQGEGLPVGGTSGGRDFRWEGAGLPVRRLLLDGGGLLMEGYGL